MCLSGPGYRRAYTRTGKADEWVSLSRPTRPAASLSTSPAGDSGPHNFNVMIEACARISGIEAGAVAASDGDMVVEREQAGEVGAAP